MKKFIAFLFFIIIGCTTTPEERWMQKERQQIVEMSTTRDNKLVVEIRYTLPLSLAHDIKTGEKPKENIVDGAKDVMIATLNVIGTLVDPIYVALPITGYVASAIIQKVGDTKFAATTIEIPMEPNKEINLTFETNEGRCDIKNINVK